MAVKYVYKFGGGKADGTGAMKNLLGGKGANLADMSRLGIPVPPGFSVTTEVCTYYYDHGRQYPKELDKQIRDALATIEKLRGRKFGDPKHPLLVSVRSGARQSMPGMMETVLNVGLTETTLQGLIEETGDPRFVYDSYRRLIMMYSDVVMEKAAGVETKEGHGIRAQLEHLLEQKKHEKGVTLDTDLSAEDWKDLSAQFKQRVQEVLGHGFPDDPMEQLYGGVGAVFASWNGRRAIEYRRIEKIPDHWGTAVNVQAMVFGNMGDDCSTGVAFTRNPATGENYFYGEFLTNAQGEDVVAGTRTPSPINDESKNDANRTLKTLAEASPAAYKQLDAIRLRLESHYKDMQDIEFTIERGKLWMLQTRTGKRTGPAAIRMAVDMAEAGVINKKTALMRVKPSQLEELLHPMLDPAQELTSHVIAKGLPAGPGGAGGEIVFTADDAERLAKEGHKVLLVRNETSPEDVHGMHAAAGILTAKGGMTSHAALVARGWGKCCIVGCAALHIDVRSQTLTVDGEVYHQGDWFTLNGTAGKVYDRRIDLVEPDLEHHDHYRTLMTWADQVRKLGIRTNADTPQDASQARKFGAEGIGLCRTEHMFFDPERIKAVRELILSKNDEARRAAVMKLLPFQRKDFEGILEAMQGLPVTIRLLDPPLHEFMPQTDAQIEELAQELGASVVEIKARLAQLHELNPMLGHRGCRLGITYPMVTEMQVRAIFEAAALLAQRGIKTLPEVMVPLIGTKAEFTDQAGLIRKVAAEVQQETGVKFDYLVGTMIELPRAALVADKVAEEAEFFSFGTNDLTQTTFGFSRDDIGGFLPEYLDKKILPEDPFQSIDVEGVGQLVAMATERGRATRPTLKVGICGEHGGDPASVHFFHKTGLNYVSCSPFRVPIARFAAAQAALLDEQAAAKKPAAKSAKKAAAKKTASKSVVKKAAPKKAVKAVAKKAAPKKPAAKKRKTVVKKKVAKKAPIRKKAPGKKAAHKPVPKTKSSAKKPAKPAKKASSDKTAKKKGRR
jgi:pyruvate,orthophosphate dikinase